MTPRSAPPPRVILIGGGARSGKSRFALARACALGQRRTFVATAEALDDEMAERIRHHRAERDAGWTTIEEPLALAGALDSTGPADVVLVDCLTLWVSNLLVAGASPARVTAAFDELQGALGRRRGHVILVTNEVGMGLVPDTTLGRVFRDAIGDLHQRLSAGADEIYVAVLGTILRLKPNPVAAMVGGGPPDESHEGDGDGARGGVRNRRPDA